MENIKILKVLYIVNVKNAKMNGTQRLKIY